MLNKAEYLVPHHTGVSSSLPQLWAVNNYHRNQGFPKSQLGFYVGYHWFIERSGNKIRCRNDWEEGAHAIGSNFKSIGTGFAGNFDIETPTEPQLKTLRTLVASYNLPVRFHREVQINRTCPGKFMNHEILKEPIAPSLDDIVKATEISRRFNIPVQTILEWFKKWGR